MNGEDIYTSAERLGDTEVIGKIRKSRMDSGDPIPASVKKGRDTLLECAYSLAASGPVIDGRNNGSLVIDKILIIRRDAETRQISGATQTAARA